MRVLLASGANPALDDADGKNALEITYIRKRWAVVSLLEGITRHV